MCKSTPKLTIAVSSRALFDLEESHAVFETHGVEAYSKFQIERENDILKPGNAFLLVKKLLALKSTDKNSQVEVILVSRNNADTGLRVFHSINYYGLNITRAAFTNGQSPYKYIKPFNVDLFLSTDPNDVKAALDAGFASATIFPKVINSSLKNQRNEIFNENFDPTVRIAFDGDSVIFSDDAEKVFQTEGLDAFSASESESANTPLPGGPFKNFLAALHRIQSSYPADESPIITGLFTARAAPAHERVIKTLRAWNIRIDEAVFLGGFPKTAFLQTFDSDIYFDDQKSHTEIAKEHVATGHVPFGVANNNTVDDLSDQELEEMYYTNEHKVSKSDTDLDVDFLDADFFDESVDNLNPITEQLAKQTIQQTTPIPSKSKSNYFSGDEYLQEINLNETPKPKRLRSIIDHDEY